MSEKCYGDLHCVQCGECPMYTECYDGCDDDDIDEDFSPEDFGGFYEMEEK